MNTRINPTVVVLILLAFINGAYGQTAERNTALRFVRNGVEQIKSGDYPGARDSFEQAVRYDDRSSAAHAGLGIAYFHLRQDGSAASELSRAVELNPQEATAYQFLGELAYRRDDLESAASYWERAVALNPQETTLRSRLERIRKEHRAEKDFNRQATSHFLIKYEGRERNETGRIILKVLEDAYSEVGHALSYYPDQEIQVILYSGDQFQEVTDAPRWSGGIFDGKIRLPIGGIDQETPALRKVLFHEYTHAVLHAITRRCPTWLNEGLAQYFEGKELDDRQRELLRKIVRSEKASVLAGLEGSFMGLNGGEARYAYLISLSSVRYLVESFGMYRVKGVLESLAAGADTPKAIGDGIMLSYEEFERGWKQSLE